MRVLKIESLQNPNVKRWSKIFSSKKVRRETKTFIVDGHHLVLEALKEKLVLELIISNEKFNSIQFDNTFYVNEQIMKKIVGSENPQGIAAVCFMPTFYQSTISDRILLLDDVSDPGNLGTIIRIADAFNFDCIYASSKTVDVFNHKTIRSTQGSLFRVPIIYCDLVEKINELTADGFEVIGASLDSKTELSEIDHDKKLGFVLGNEARGISQEILNNTTQNIIIDMPGNSESLNVAVASGIIGYNFRKSK